MERRMVKVLKPVLTKAAGVPMPQDSVFDAIQRLHMELSEVHSLLTGPEASVRLVLTPEAVVVAEARRSLTTLSLYGYRVDGVIANRIFPAADADVWRRQWVASQSQILQEVEASFAPIDVWRSPYRACEPVGLAEVAAFAAELYGTDDPFRQVPGREPVAIRRIGGQTQLKVALPFAHRGDVALARHGEDLVVTVGSYRRLLALPLALQQARVTGARLHDGELVVGFESAPHDPAVVAR
jgi:arsenite-transporting ATPase